MDLNNPIAPTARSYQEEILEIARHENVVVYLPTGSGKTFIAVMLLNEIGCSEANKGKNIIFLANTVQLVHQHATTIRSFTNLLVNVYTGDMNVDNWSKDAWDAAKKQYDILLMTPEIYKNNLYARFMSLNEASLIVFDECHHATKNHPMMKILDEYHSCEDKPRLLGLTAVLLNTIKRKPNYTEEIEAIERTFEGRIVTSSDENVSQYSTNASDVLVLMKAIDGENNYSNLRNLMNIKFCCSNEFNSWIRKPMQDCELYRDISNGTIHRLERLLSSATDDSDPSQAIGIKNILNNLGLFPFTEVCSIEIIEAEIAKFCSYRKINTSFLQLLSSRLSMMRKSAYLRILKNSTPNPLSTILNHCSPKVKALVLMLSKFKPEDRILIFVKQRLTAKVLYLVLQKLSAFSKKGENLSHIKVNFVIGGGNNSLNRNEQIKQNKACRATNQKIIKWFNECKVNVLIATSVLEEGIDIKQCNVAIQFDTVFNFRSYIQYKGRARDRNSLYISYIASEKEKSKITSHIEMSKCVQILTEQILKRNEDEYKSHEEFKEEEIYLTKAGGKATLFTAPIIIDRYCNTFASEYDVESRTPYWWKKRVGLDRVQCILQLPLVSSHPEPIIGPARKNAVAAQRAVALLAVEILHKSGLLDDRLIPIKRDFKKLCANEEFLCPYWRDDDTEKAGTKKNLRVVNKQVPKKNNIPLANESAFFYDIRFEATDYNIDDTSRMINENCKMGIGFVTNNQIIMVDDFKVFTKYGNYTVHISKVGVTKFDSAQIRQIRDFHLYLFREYMHIVKPFLIFDVDQSDDACFIVPTIQDRDTNVITIDWQILGKKYPIVPYKSGLSLRNGDIVSPIHQLHQNRKYIIVNDDLAENALSKFGDKGYKNYVEYFKRRYGIDLDDHNSPLVHVKNYNTSFSSVIPIFRKKSKLNYIIKYPKEMLLKYDIHPLVLLKIQSLPIIFHRINRMKLAYVLGEKIAIELHLIIPSNFSADEIDAEVQRLIMYDKHRYVNKSAKSNGDSEDSDDSDGDLNCLDLIRMQRYFTPRYLMRYCEALSRPNDDTGPKFKKQSKVGLKPAPKLQIFTSTNNDLIGPTSIEILQAITAANCNDSFNCERLETMGDSFLKFAVCLSLTMTRATYDEGKMTYIKDKLIGNRNLYYVGSNFGINSLIQFQEFKPEMWCPPGFCVPDFLKRTICNENIPSEFLATVKFAEDEQINGHVWDDSVEQLIVEGENYKNKFVLKNEYLSPYVHYLNRAVISDKCVADSVEALVGLYLTKCGFCSAYDLLGTLGLLIRSEFSYKKIMAVEFTTRSIDSVTLSYHLPDFRAVENTIGYTFNNKQLLLRAMVHPSYSFSQGRVTETYQILEFLGDAILDFLITSYIYQYCGNLPPGKLTDLRSSLVNNVTFGCLAVRYNLHKSLKYSSYKLFNCISNFVRFQEENNHSVSNAITFLYKNYYGLAASYFVPKPLGDIFESLAAAIYLDSNKSLETVWTVYYNLMETELREFVKKTPINPVRELYESPLNFKLQKIKSIDDSYSGHVYTVTVYEGNEEKVYHGFGTDANSAKRAAAVFALKGSKNGSKKYDDDDEDYTIIKELMKDNFSNNDTKESEGMEHDTPDWSENSKYTFKNKKNGSSTNDDIIQDIHLIMDDGNNTQQANAVKNDDNIFSIDGKQDNYRTFGTSVDKEVTGKRPFYDENQTADNRRQEGRHR